MHRWWPQACAWAHRQRASGRAAMILYAALDVAAWFSTPGPATHVSAGPVWPPVAAFLAWRVGRGGDLSRVLLILGTGLSFLRAALGVARAWDVPILILLLIYAAQLMLLISAVVYRRTRRDRAAGLPDRPLGWPVPPAWVVLGGLAGGVAVTLAYLGSMNSQPLPGCGPHGATLQQLPDRCITLAEGYPLRFLSADQNVPEINKAAMARDWVQWSLVTTSALYLLCWSDTDRWRRVPD